MNVLLEAPSPALVGRVWPDDYPADPIRTIGLRRDDPECVASARRFVAGCCRSFGTPEWIAADAVLCVSELAGNVVRAAFPRGRSRFFIQFLRAWPFTIVRVHDPSPVLPSPHLVDLDALLMDADLDAEIGGWGLSSVVDSLTDHFAFGTGPHMKFAEFWIATPFGGAR